jgi:hypothetical protein
MLSEVIHSRHSYPAVPLARQPVDQRSVLQGPLVLSKNPLKNRRPQQIGDQPVSRNLLRKYADLRADQKRRSNADQNENETFSVVTNGIGL